MRVVVAGGGTAGHVFPALATARVLEREHGAEVAFVGTPGGMEAGLVRAAGFAFHPVETLPFVRTLSPAALRGPWSAARAVARCRPIVASADVVLGMGGYVSVPAALATLRVGRPLVVHEQNAVPGLANRLLARRAGAVGLGFADAALRLPRRARVAVTGNPVREEIAAVPRRRQELASRALEELGLEPERRTVVVFGGSQGALHVNRATVAATALLAGRGDLQVLLLAGRAHYEAMARSVGEPGELLARTLPFLERMELAYAVADLIVARAGATSIAEITVCGIPSVLIPYPYATGGHQEANARAVQRAGAASLLLDEDLTPALLAERIEELVDDDERRGAMADRASAFARPDAAAALAELVAEAGTRR